jgi:hypothetical protein
VSGFTPACIFEDSSLTGHFFGGCYIYLGSKIARLARQSNVTVLNQLRKSFLRIMYDAASGALAAGNTLTIGG